MRQLMEPSARTAHQSIAVLSLAGVLLLSGCATMEVLKPSESPATSATPEPSATIVPEVEEIPVSVAISATGIDLLDSEGDSLESFDYFDDDDGDEIIDVLTELFGSEPDVTHQDAVTHFREVDENAWSGFVVRDYGSAGGYAQAPAFSVYATSAEEGEIAIVTGEGVAVGTTRDEVEKTAYKENVTEFDGEPLSIYMLDENLLPEGEITYLEDGPAAYSISAWVYEKDGAVSKIVAPTVNFGS